MMVFLYNNNNNDFLMSNRMAAALLAFGTQRHLRLGMVMHEVLIGCFVLLPMAVIIGLATIRVAVTGGGKCVRTFLRPDVWTSLVLFIVATVLMEILLPSLQCYPLLQEEVSYNGDGSNATTMPYGLWLQQSWGFHCPPPLEHDGDDDDKDSMLLTRQAVAVLISIRLFFLCMGIYIGESFVPIALTGGIACGKSTVAKMLSQQSPSSSHTSVYSNGKGTFTTIDADSIAHEILLPSHVLATTPPPPEFNKTSWTVQPHESVYNRVLQAFPTDDRSGSKEDDKDGGDDSKQQQQQQQQQHFLVNEQGGLIDRTKLGDVVFANAAARRRLGSITHPQILKIMLKRIVQSIYLANKSAAAADFVCVDVPLLFESGALVSLFALVLCVAVEDEAVILQRLQSRNPEWTVEHCRSRISSQMPVSEKAKRSDFVIDNSGNSMSQLQEDVEHVRLQVEQRIRGVLGLTLVQMILLLSLCFLSMLVFATKGNG